MIAKIKNHEQKERTYKKNLLIVEDELPLLDILSECFTYAGYNVSQATHGEEGIEQAIKIHPDIILLDLLMPGMDGLTMLKELFNKHHWAKNTSVIILSNIRDINEIKEAKKLDVCYYLIKSNLKLNDLVKKVEQIINEK